MLVLATSNSKTFPNKGKLDWRKMPKNPEELNAIRHWNLENIEKVLNRGWIWHHKNKQKLSEPQIRRRRQKIRELQEILAKTGVN
ncbi:hypothetical protein HY440_03225 [Candidatus Microgenomates bacterium]|nr:hypothetical protein [Candidatus Microgenomates bacterium]